MVKSLQKKYILALAVVVAAFTAIPVPKDKLTYSRSLYSKDGQLLSAKVSRDGHWCLPLDGDLPHAFEACIIEYEDAWFYWHPGINPVSVVKAFIANYQSLKTKRGASTLAMQVMRMRYKNARRSLANKMAESLCAVKYSLTRTKSTVLLDWAQMAPFGGNTVGARSASLRYFGRDLTNLSWAEYAMLAVMPNSPTTANLRVNREKLKSKRDFLLKKLCQKGHFSNEDLKVYLSEELPVTLRQIPDKAPFLLDYLSKKYEKTFLFASTIDQKIQEEVTEIVEKEVHFLQQDDIRNAAAIVINVEDNTLLAYVGNVRKRQDQSLNFVDIAQAPLSYGSLLKPFLYAYAMEEGFILPGELVFDIPTVIGDFRPQNFDETFRGAARVDEVILSSLNVPSVRLLNQVGLPGFYNMLQKLKPAYLNKGVGHYGLSLILGGGETSLWEMCRLYKGLASNYAGKPEPYNQVRVLGEDAEEDEKKFQFSPSVVQNVVHTMTDLSRPREERFWFAMDPTKKIAWKTGTSYGHRDAWCIGFNGKYLVGIWIGNENGEGRHDLTGISKAAPLMFQIFKALPSNDWFEREPVYQAGKTISVCRESGRLAGKLCKHTEKRKVEKESFRWSPCRFHTEAWLNTEGLWSSPECAPEGYKDTLFTLPPEVEYYYKASHLFYKSLPGPDPSCHIHKPSLTVIYPTEGVKIFIPKGDDGRHGSMVSKAHHSVPGTRLFWYLDNKPLGENPSDQHSWHRVIRPEPGKHEITVIDTRGNQSSVRFEVIQ
jgi:penicillin-binding protein 1C